jgi:hypothetical protein
MGVHHTYPVLQPFITISAHILRHTLFLPTSLPKFHQAGEEDKTPARKTAVLAPYSDMMLMLWQTDKKTPATK